MFGKLLGWLVGGGIAAIGKQVNRAIEIREQAKNNQARIEADKFLAELLAQQRIVLAEQEHWQTRWIRPTIAAPFALFIWKVVVWDTMWGLGVTDPLSDRMAQIMMVVLGSYFVGRGIEKAFRR